MQINHLSATQPGDAQRDEHLWYLARKRAAFKWGLLSYVVVNLFLVAIWYMTTGPGNYFWPKWVLLGWGVGLLFHYLEAYQGSRFVSAKREYEKLKKQNNQ